MVEQDSGVLCIKKLLHGFYEEQLLGFFSQFGEVEAVRVKRSRRSGLSCGVGYVKFTVPEVAAIAGKSMDGYMMYGETLRTRIQSCQWLTARPDLFRKSDTAAAIEKRKRRGFKEERDQRLRRRQERGKKENEGAMTYETYVRKCHRMVEADQKLAERIREMGIEYTYLPLQLTAETQKDWETLSKNDEAKMAVSANDAEKSIPESNMRPSEDEEDVGSVEEM